MIEKGELERLIQDIKEQIITEFERRITEDVKKYIDTIVKPIVAYFKKKKDFYEMSYL